MMALPFGRTFSDLLLFSVTSGELALLFYLDPSFTIVEWIYLSQHLVVLGIALTRRSPQAQDRSLPSGVAVFVAYTYAYAQLVWLAWRPGVPTWPAGGLVLVTLGACLSLASLLSLGRWVGNRPAWPGLAAGGADRGPCDVRVLRVGRYRVPPYGMEFRHGVAGDRGLGEPRLPHSR